MADASKTIFISITRGSAARSFLRSDFLQTILRHGGVRVVLLVYLFDGEVVHDYFKEEFKHPLISIEQVSIPRHTKFRKLFIQLFNGLIYSTAEYRHLKYGSSGHRKKESTGMFLLKHWSFVVLSKFMFLRRLARWSERHVFIDRAYGDLFEKYHPDLVFCTTVYGTVDVGLIKEAYFRGVRSVSTPKSWDTVTRLFFRFPSEKMVVANQWMKDIISEEQLIDARDITVTGLIQFDVYGNKKQYLSKEEFCTTCGLDAQKPIVLFAPEGLLTGDDELYIRELLHDGTFLSRYNLIIRPHFSDIAQDRYKEFRTIPGIYLDDQNLRITNMFHDWWDPTNENAEWQAEVLHATDVVICFMSTMVLDAHILDRPVIVIKYEPVGTTRAVPIDLLYTFRHIEAMLEERSLLIAESKEELFTAVAHYIQDPSLHRQERASAVRRFAGVIDGGAGKRTAEVVLALLGYHVN